MGHPVFFIYCQSHVDRFLVVSSIKGRGVIFTWSREGGCITDGEGVPQMFDVEGGKCHFSKSCQEHTGTKFDVHIHSLGSTKQA